MVEIWTRVSPAIADWSDRMVVRVRRGRDFMWSGWVCRQIEFSITDLRGLAGGVWKSNRIGAQISVGSIGGLFLIARLRSWRLSFRLMAWMSARRAWIS